MKGKILVTGGAGYIGSFIVRDLSSKGYVPVVVDDLSSGHKRAIEGFELHEINIAKEYGKLNDLLSKEKFDGVIHMAAFIQMGESFKNPIKYFDNNVLGGVNLLNAMVQNGVSNIVFSSSAGVYGNPESLPIKESDPKNPLNPYGETKYMTERMLSWMDKSHGVRFTSIRYFNAAGASLDGKLGEDHPEESHLIPCVMKAALKREEFEVFGSDYDTPDGTNVRDYIHVLDLSRAHVSAVESLISGGESDFFNAGAGKGYSNKEVIGMIGEVTGVEVKVKYGPRRQGDAAALYASIDKIKDKLGWEPEYGLKEIIESAYKWHSQNPEGYKKG